MSKAHVRVTGTAALLQASGTACDVVRLLGRRVDCLSTLLRNQALVMAPISRLSRDSGDRISDRGQPAQPEAHGFLLRLSGRSSSPARGSDAVPRLLVLNCVFMAKCFDGGGGAVTRARRSAPSERAPTVRSRFSSDSASATILAGIRPPDSWVLSAAGRSQPPVTRLEHREPGEDH